jgi:hypothetical protein
MAVVTVLAVGFVSAALPGSALADPTVAIVPPSGATWRSDCPNGAPGPCNRTTDPRPVFGIEANGVDPGDQLQCWFDYADPGPCGPPLPSCTAQLCASAQPSTPLSADSGHSVSARLVDSNGNVVVGASTNPEVDLAIAEPPTISFGRGFGTLWQPMFSYEGGGDVGQAECSLTAFGSEPSWGECQGSADQGEATVGLPHRREDYTFRMRAIDDFGRVAYPERPMVDFDPIPCASRAPGVSIATVISRGLPIRSSCSFVPGMYVSLFVFPYHGHGQKPLAVKVVKGPASGRWTTSFRLRPQADAASFMRRFRSLRTVLFSDPADHCPGAPCTYSRRRLTLRG